MRVKVDLKSIRGEEERNCPMGSEATGICELCVKMEMDLNIRRHGME